MELLNRIKNSKNPIFGVYHKLGPKLMGAMLSYWGPFLGAGIRITHISEDFTQINAELRNRLYNKNLFGVHFGGAIYALVDPFYVLMLVKGLGRDFIVWDKSAEVKFLKPGKGTLRAEFHISTEEMEGIRKTVLNKKRYLFKKNIEVLNDKDEVVASIDKVVSIKLKDA